MNIVLDINGKSNAVVYTNYGYFHINHTDFLTIQTDAMWIWSNI